MAEALSPEEQIMALRRELAERDAIIAAREAELAEAAIVKAKLTAALLEIEQIKMQLATLRRQRYFRSSEKLDNDIAQLEMRLEDCEEDVGEHLAARPELDRHSAPRPRGKSGRKPLPPHLPREVVVHEPEIVCSCGNCDPARLTRLGELITEVLEKIPARLKVIRHVRPKYACRLCERIFQAPAPELPIEKGRPGAPDCWPTSRSRNTATGCHFTASRASWRAKASRSTGPRWPNGWVTWRGGCVPWQR